MNIYAKNILDNYKNPRNFGVLKNADSSFKFSNSSCGDELEVFLKLKNNKLEKIKFQGHGCAVSIASASILSEVLIGKEPQEIFNMDLNSVQKILGIEISSRRHKCALISLKSIKGALKELDKS